MALDPTRETGVQALLISLNRASLHSLLEGMILMKMEHVPGRDKGKITLYALSTCGWCKRTRELLQELGVDHSYVYVDLLPPDEMEEALLEVERYNPRGSFPTLVIGDKVIIGFREQEIREALV
jgi:glutaredoxin-like protein NrdH